jgi:Protein of unknown function (DUF4236)/DnaJ domain
VGWYFRRSIGFGPFRVNLSKSGIGWSVGVRGARVGTGPHGNYVRIGRDGVYYQKYSGGGRAAASNRANPQPTAEAEAGPTPLTIDPSGLRDASAADLIREIHEKRSTKPRAPLCALAFLLVVFTAAILAQTGYAIAALLLAALSSGPAAGWFWLRRIDQARRIVHLTYDLDTEARARYEQLITALRTLGSCGGLWRVTDQRTSTNLKYSSGAAYSVQRIPATCNPGAPKNLETNVTVMELGLGNQQLFFLPDRMLMYAGGAVGAVEYSYIGCDVDPTSFIENGPVPGDTQVLRTVWQYANRDGGPDRRFSYNPQLPVVQYAEIRLQSTTGLNFVLQASNLDKAWRFREGLLAYAARGKARPESQSGAAASSDAAGTQSRSKPSDYMPRPIPRSPSAYEVLQVAPGSTIEQIAAAYRKLAQMYHPDKVANLGPELRELAEQKMKEINAAYEELKKRASA